ncbi:MAG: ribose 5-phosphate isomerase B [Alphaproteobacteria bacterium]|jgi:ribose 5-phosphate isomerase B
MNWVVASDHAGYQLKNILSKQLQSLGYFVADLGTECAETSVDYPDYADKAVQAILSSGADMAILVCGTGLGVSMRANRYNGIRATLIHNEFTAKAAKEHSNANILCFGERVIDEATALACLKTFLDAKFEGGRHQARLDKLDAPLLENK